MTTTTVSENATPQFLHLSTRQLVDLLLLFWQRPYIHPRVIATTLDPLRAELQRREALKERVSA